MLPVSASSTHGCRVSLRERTSGYKRQTSESMTVQSVFRRRRPIQCRQTVAINRREGERMVSHPIITTAHTLQPLLRQHWVKTHEIGCCFPVGAHSVQVPSDEHLTQQVSSEPACLPCKGPYGAGCSEQAGRAVEPRERCRGGKPTVSRHWKAVVLGALWQVRRTHQSINGALSPQGELGNLCREDHAQTFSP